MRSLTSLLFVSLMLGPWPASSDPAPDSGGPTYDGGASDGGASEGALSDGAASDGEGADGSADAGGIPVNVAEDEGCSCSLGSSPRSPGDLAAAIGLLALLLLGRRGPSRQARGRASR